MNGWGSRLTKLIFTVLPWAIIISGVVLLVQPIYSDWKSAREAEESISEVMSIYDDMDDPDRLANLEQARAFNTRLASPDTYVEPDGGLWDYRTQLTYRGTPASMMSWVDIPKIATRLPIFHYATNEVLSAGVGHIEWSSLPVGGEGSRCIVSAHSGMQDTRMFDDIRKLEIGDTFVFWTLSEPYCYRVCEIETILPDQVDKLAAEPGRDLATLVTCTPFGVNTHRLCVTGERCEYVEEVGETAPVEAYVNRRTIPLLVGLGIVFGAGLLIVIMGVHRRKRRVAQVSE